MRRYEREPSSANLMHVVSMIKLQNMQTGKGKFWRRRGGSSRMSLMSSVSQDSKTVSRLKIILNSKGYYLCSVERTAGLI